MPTPVTLLRRRPGEAQHCCLVASVDDLLALASAVLSETHEVLQRRVIGKMRLQDEGFWGCLDSVLDELQQLERGGHAKVLDAQLFPEVLVVVELHMHLVERGTFGIIQVMPEGMHQEVQLEAETQKFPVLIGKVCEEGLAVADVAHILHGKGVEVISVDLHFDVVLFLLSVLLLLVIPLLGFAIRLALLLGGLLLIALHYPLALELLLSDGILPIRLLFVPVVQQPLPLVPLILEPGARLKVLDPLSQLLLCEPLLEVSSTSASICPGEADLVEAFFLSGDGEGCVCLPKFFLREVMRLRLPEGRLQLLLGQSDLCLSLFDGLLQSFLRFLRLLCSIFSSICNLQFLLRLLAFQNPFPSNLAGRLFLLIFEQFTLDGFLVVCRRLAHDNYGHLFEVRAVESSQRLRSLCRKEVVSHLHDHEALPQKRNHRVDEPLDAQVVQLSNAELKTWTVVAVPPKIAFRAVDATLLSPLEQRPIA
mmetsp:Transcript_65373/g.142498  ORF Transcript_65373/g.142498 Transcript_65373/m.142498 type:complete len:479 (+) Transcript_65373:666-2102(+)